MNESFNTSTGTQRADMGMYKKFTLNLTNVAVPNLIAYDLVIVQPMSSMSGYITYINYTAGTNKGATKQGDVFNNPFKLGNVDVNYTASKVAETVKAVAATGTEAATHTTVTVNWTPILTENVVCKVAGATVTPAAISKDGVIKFAVGDVAVGTDVAVLYDYDNVVIPQNDLPIINAKIENIALTAKARRIAVYYSQMAAFQAKTDYGFDLADQLAEKAVGQLSYEIDTEITDLLVENAANDGDLVWSKTLPVGVSKAEHYEGFTEIVEIARQKIYDRTRRLTDLYIAA